MAGQPTLTKSLASDRIMKAYEVLARVAFVSILGSLLITRCTVHLSWTT